MGHTLLFAVGAWPPHDGLGEVFTEDTAEIGKGQRTSGDLQDVLLLDTDVLGSEQTECGVLQGCGIAEGSKSRILALGTAMTFMVWVAR